jgi:hypothetical protein
MSPSQLLDRDVEILALQDDEAGVDDEPNVRTDR